MRTILTPPEIPGAALDALKAWLAISSSAEDAALTAQLAVALEICEAFTGLLPLEAECEEILPAAPAAWQALVTRPVQAVTAIEGIPADEPRFALAADAYAVELDADGGARVRILRQGSAGRIAVQFTAGLAGEWGELPEALRQGAVRLAAHQYRARDGEPGQPALPAAIAALWRPWRRYRLS
jgi:uncharacterized phiE125 gp8 family phage protein